MNCEETKTMLGAHLDGELDAVNDRELQEHLRTCPRCLRGAGEQQALRRMIRQEAPYHRASQALRVRIQGTLRPAGAPERERGVRVSDVEAPVQTWFHQWWRAAAMVAALFVFLVGGYALTELAASRNLLAEELVSAHVRSLLPDHLTDVLSSDQHTVKPWFAGKTDFAPPVRDFAADGFPLVGGRLDYVAGHPAAALVYQRNKHVINLFVWPSASGGAPIEHILSRRGYNLVSWQQDDLVFCAVSDLNRLELELFADKYRGK